MNKKIKYFIFTILFIVGLFSFFKGYSTSNEVGVLIEYKDTILKENTPILNTLSDIISLNSNENRKLLDNRSSDVILNSENNTIVNGGSNVNITNPYYGINQNAPKNPTIYSPISSLSGSVNIQYGIPLFFISYFEDGNKLQKGGYTIVKIIDNGSGGILNRFFIGQAKSSDTYQKPAINKTYTYGFYQTQDTSELFLSGGNINLTPSGIKNINKNIYIPIGDYSVYLQNINRYGIKSDEVFAGNINIIDSNNTLGSVVSVGKIGLEKTDLLDLNFSDFLGININGTLGTSASVELKNNTTNKVITNYIENSGNYSFQNVSLQEGINSVSITFKDSSSKIINTVPLFINVDTKSPIPQILGINTGDYMFSGATILKTNQSGSGQINMVNFKGLTHINDNLSSNGVDNIGNGIPFYLEYTELSDKDISVYHGDVNNILSINNLVTNITSSGTALSGKKFLKFYINELTNIDQNKRKYFILRDDLGNTSNIYVVDFYINRNVNTPKVVTNNGNAVVTTNNTIDLRLSLDQDIKYISLNGIVYPVNYISDYTLYGVSLKNGENIFNIKSIDIMGRESNAIEFLIVKEDPKNSGLAGSDDSLIINGNVNASEIDFNRVTKEGGNPGEIINGN